MVMLMPERDNPRFDPRGRRLVYVQIADEIAARIEDGTYPPESRLPALEQIAVEYGTARMTARRAIRHLADLGLVEIVPGKGTYVLAPGNRRPPPG